MASSSPPTFRDLWIHRETAMSFVGDYPWAKDGYFKVVCESEVTSEAAPLPKEALRFLLESASIAFEWINATGETSSEIRSYFKSIDPTACELVKDMGSSSTITYVDKDGPVTLQVPRRITQSDIIIFYEHHRVHALIGDFGTEMIPEDSHINQLSSNCVGTYDTRDNHWTTLSIDNSNLVGFWASPCLGVA